MTSVSVAIKFSNFIEEIMKNSCRTVLAFWFCFYAHDNYITLEKAKLLIIKTTEENQKPEKKLEMFQ